MAAVVRLTAQTGPHKEKKFCFRAGTDVRIGRGPDCFVQLVGMERDRLISRNHCELTVGEETITLQDLGSRNGTFLNGHRIENLEMPLTSEHACAGCQGATYETSLLTVGGTTIQLDVVDCPPRQGGCHKETEVWKDQETTKKDCPIDCSGRDT